MEEIASWLNQNVARFCGTIDRTEQAAEEVTEPEGLLRRIGHFRNAFEPGDAFYQFRSKAFELGRPSTKEAPLSPTKLCPVA